MTKKARSPPRPVLSAAIDAERARQAIAAAQSRVAASGKDDVNMGGAPPGVPDWMAAVMQSYPNVSVGELRKLFRENSAELDRLTGGIEKERRLQALLQASALRDVQAELDAGKAAVDVQLAPYLQAAQKETERQVEAEMVKRDMEKAVGAMSKGKLLGLAAKKMEEIRLMEETSSAYASDRRRLAEQGQAMDNKLASASDQLTRMAQAANMRQNYEARMGGVNGDLNRVAEENRTMQSRIATMQKKAGLGTGTGVGGDGTYGAGGALAREGDTNFGGSKIKRPLEESKALGGSRSGDGSKLIASLTAGQPVMGLAGAEQALDVSHGIVAASSATPPVFPQKQAQPHSNSNNKKHCQPSDRGPCTEDRRASCLRDLVTFVVGSMCRTIMATVCISIRISNPMGGHNHRWRPILIRSTKQRTLMLR